MGPVSLDNTFGAVFIGTILGCILYGLIIYQAYRYGMLFPKDSSFLKRLVVAIVVFETLHTALWIFVCYKSGVTYYLDLSELFRNHWYITLTILVAEITGLTNPIFYARQVYLAVPRFRWIVAISVLAMVGGLAFSIVATVKGFQAANLEEFAAFNWIVCAAYGCTLTAEVLLATTLIGWLRNTRSSFARTNSVVAMLITYVVHTGLLNTIFGLFVFVFALVYPHNLIYTGISIVGTKLCSFSVLAVLNSRASLSALLLHQTTVETASELAFPSCHTRTIRDLERDGTSQVTATPMSSGMLETAYGRSDSDPIRSQEGPGAVEHTPAQATAK